MTTSSVTSSFVSFAPDERRITEYHVVEETGALSAADILRVLFGLLLWIPAVLLARTFSPVPLLFGLALLLPGIYFIVQLFVRPHVSELLTITSDRVIHYRREHGRFHDGHIYQNVRVRDVSGVTTDHEHRLAGERIGILVYTARADAMAVGAGRSGNLIARLFARQNMGPDAVRAIRELPSLLPALRAGERTKPQAEIVEDA